PEARARFPERMPATPTPGGVPALMAPTYKSCADESFDCADPLLALPHLSVQEHLFAAGYHVREVVPRFLPFSFRSRLPASPALTRLYLRMPVLWRVQGKQFLILATP